MFFFTFLINENNRKDKMTNIMNQGGSITINPTDIKSMIRKYSRKIVHINSRAWGNGPISLKDFIDQSSFKKI